jgi:hypothetical protein
VAMAHHNESFEDGEPCLCLVGLSRDDLTREINHVRRGVFPAANTHQKRLDALGWLRRLEEVWDKLEATGDLLTT